MRSKKELEDVPDDQLDDKEYYIKHGSFPKPTWLVPDVESRSYHFSEETGSLRRDDLVVGKIGNRILYQSRRDAKKVAREAKNDKSREARRRRKEKRARRSGIRQDSKSR